MTIYGYIDGHQSLHLIRYGRNVTLLSIYGESLGVKQP